MRRAKSTGWGNGEQRMHPRSVLIFNFDVGISQLKAEHREMLHDWVVPWLKWGNSVIPVGLASRTGRSADNLHLSQMRAGRTRDFLLSEVPKGFVAQVTLGFGEMKAKAEGYRDNTEDKRFRSVLILFGRGPVPPFPPGLIDITPEMPDEYLEEESDVDMGKVNDVLSGIAQFLELMPWEELAAAAEFGDLLTAVIGPLILMPMLWSDVRALNEKNGGLEGFWDAMQAMADQYSNPALSTTRLSEWPVLKEPRPKSFGIPSSLMGLNEREWMNGRRKGCRAAFEIILRMERQPRVVKNWEITGRRHLFMLSHRFGIHVAEEIKAYVNKRLHDQKKPPWPILG